MRAIGLVLLLLCGGMLGGCVVDPGWGWHHHHNDR
jgi:hypothetical protein